MKWQKIIGTMAEVSIVVLWAIAFVYFFVGFYIA